MLSETKLNSFLSGSTSQCFYYASELCRGVRACNVDHALGLWDTFRASPEMFVPEKTL